MHLKGMIWGPKDDGNPYLANYMMLIHKGDGTMLFDFRLRKASKGQYKYHEGDKLVAPEEFIYGTP